MCKSFRNYKNLIMNIFLSSILILIQIQFNTPTPLHDNRCNIWDSECLVRVLQRLSPIVAAGIPELGTQKLDPLYVPRIQINQDHLKADYEHIEIHGAGKSLVDKARLNKFAKQIYLRYYVPCLTINGTYKSFGALHKIPVEGKGDIYIRLDNLEMDAIYDYEEAIDENGKKIVHIKNVRYSFEVLDGAVYLLSNLYYGDTIKSTEMHNYINKYWKLISFEFGRVFLDKLNDATFNAMKTFLRSQPLDVFFYNY